MAEGQIQDITKSNRKNRDESTKPTSSNEGNSQSTYERLKSEGEAFEELVDRNQKLEDARNKKRKDIASRRDIASEIKDLSKRGALTPELLKDARQKATAAGVTEDQFNTFLEKSSIRQKGSPFSYKKPKKGTGLFDQPTTAPTASEAPTVAADPTATSKEEAAQNVMFQRQYGTGLGTLKAMQDPNYVIGSGSPLREPARRIGPASGRFRSAARRLRRKGYGGAAQQMAMLGEMARMREPSIDTPALRGQRMLQRMAAAKEAQKQDKLVAENPLLLGSTKREGQRI